MKKHTGLDSRGLSARKLNYLMGGITLVISVLLLYATYRTSDCYRVMRTATEKYISGQLCAYNMQRGSDYLTDQAQGFAMTGDKSYVRQYFEEVNVTRRRDKAVEEMQAILDGEDAYKSLVAAMRESQSLMKDELYAMRLAISSFGYELSEFPKELQEIELRGEDVALSRDRQTVRVRYLVLGKSYFDKKARIEKNTQLCVAALEEKNEAEQAFATEELQRLLFAQQALIIILIVVVLTIIVVTTLLVIGPLQQGVLHIQDEQPIPLMGAYEFRFLAKTYNMMFEANRQKKEQLAYEASHDKLTGLYNRSGYEFLLQNADLETSALLMIDVDKFKGVNDTYGHQVGDQVLSKVAAVLKESFRSGDFICRIGGDEFATIMANTGPEFKDMIHDKIQRINDKLQNPADGLPPTSLSVGVAFGGNKHSTGSLVKDADVALYKVKEHGRCDCAFYE